MPDVITPAPEITDAQLRALVFEGKEPEPAAAPDPKAEPEKPAETPAAPEAKPPEEPKPAPESDPDKQEEQQGEQPKPKGGFQRRIDKLTAKVHDLERQLADKSAVQPIESPKPELAKAPEAKPKPDAKDFQDYDSYVEALADWKTEQRINAAFEKQRADEAQRNNQDRQRQLASTWQERAQKALDKDPDFQDAIDEIGPALTRAGVADVVMQSPVGPEIVAYLYEHQDDAARIAKLGSPTAIAVELGKIEAKLSTPAPQPKAQQPPLPKPPASVGGGGAPQEVNLDSCSMSQFKAEMKKQGLV